MIALQALRAHYESKILCTQLFPFLLFICFVLPQKRYRYDIEIRNKSRYNIVYGKRQINYTTGLEKNAKDSFLGQ
jgi:hypothetical protein